MENKKGKRGLATQRQPTAESDSALWKLEPNVAGGGDTAFLQSASCQLLIERDTNSGQTWRDRRADQGAKIQTQALGGVRSPQPLEGFPVAVCGEVGGGEDTHPP